MNKIRKLIASAKKAAGSLVLIAVFLLPLYLGATWIYGVTGGVDTRKVYADQEIASFGSDEYSDSGELRPFDEPIITVTFDDGWESIYTEAFPILEKYNIKSTQYILGDRFDDHAYLSEKQVLSMKSAGHEIAGHTMTHRDLSALAESDVEWELGECDRLLTSKFGEIRDFATPFGATNMTVQNHAKKYYRSTRNTVADGSTLEIEDINVRKNFNPYNINAFTIRSSTTMDELKRFLEFTKESNGWFVITYHQVEDSNPSEYNITPDMLNEQMKLIRESKIKTATLGQMLDAIERSR